MPVSHLGSDSHKLWVLRHNLRSHFDLVGLSVLGSLINAIILILALGHLFSQSLVAGLFGLLLGISGYRMIVARRFNEAQLDDTAIVRASRSVLWHAGLGSLAWGLSIFLLMGRAGPAEIAFLGMVASGMMCAGVMAYTSVPKAARLYLGIIAGFTMAGFIGNGGPLALTSCLLLSSYCFILMKAGTRSFENLEARLLRERELQDASETVQLLLNDYQDQGADWLWEVDTNGVICSPSSRFAEAVGQSCEGLAGRRFLELFRASPERDALACAIGALDPVRDLAVPLETGDGNRWWRVSCRLALDPEGVAIGLRGVATDISASKHAEVRVAYMAHYDTLTDLPNRALFGEQLCLALSGPDPKEVSILSLDLDHFKTVNDTLGHPAGDALLKVVSRRIEACLREGDVVARLGGDEFAILLGDARARASVEAVAQDIIKSLAEPVDIDGQRVLTGASIGIAIAPRDGRTVDTLMKNVDLALYSAKANGRNRLAFFEQYMDHAAQARRLVEIDLRAALAEDQLLIHYQPLINLSSGNVSGYEALLRWQHPERGLIMPSDFIGIAEETGVIVQLGEWVIRNALAQASRWPDHIVVSVNLSPAQLKSSALIPTIINALASSGVAADRLELEITEGVLMSDTDANLAILHRIRDLGVRIALDDFGTGYSSLNYLRSFPFDKIKIDRSFVQDVNNRDDCRAIVRAVTSLASSLGMVTTAEGVENAEQLAQLVQEGCTEVQGYFFSKAVPAADIGETEGSRQATVASMRERLASEMRPDEMHYRHRIARR